MDGTELLPLSHVCFRDVSWLNAFGGVSLESALDYFSLSQFYDRTCNNEVLKMQTRFTGNSTAPVLLTSKMMESQLQLMRGIEYVLLVDQCRAPRLFVVGKRERKSPQETALLECFYILDGSIYMAPSLQSLICSRLTASMAQFHMAVSHVQQHVHFDPTKRIYKLLDADADADGNQVDYPLVDDVLRRVLGS